MNKLERRVEMLERVMGFPEKKTPVVKRQAAKLECALLPGGPLYNKDAATTRELRELREFARCWRNLAADLRSPTSDNKRIDAENMLALLGIAREYGKSGYIFIKNSSVTP